MKRIFRIIMVVGVVIFIVYIGACVYGNYFVDDGSTKFPSVKNAPYSLIVRNTATVILTDEHEVIGEEGSRIFTLYGYWELVGSEFKYVDSTIILHEEVFGVINIKRRGE